MASEDTYNVFPRCCVLNMSGNRLTKFLTILVLFSRASATADLKAAGVLSSLKTFKTRGLDTSVLATCRYCLSPSAKGCKMRACLVLVCTEPRCSMRAGPVSAVASLIGCTNFVKKVLPLSPATRGPFYLSYLPQYPFVSRLKTPCECAALARHRTELPGLLNL